MLRADLELVQRWVRNGEGELTLIVICEDGVGDRRGQEVPESFSAANLRERLEFYRLLGFL